jgi:hypothetical protein
MNRRLSLLLGLWVGGCNGSPTWVDHYTTVAAPVTARFLNLPMTKISTAEMTMGYVQQCGDLAESAQGIGEAGSSPRVTFSDQPLSFSFETTRADVFNFGLLSPWCPGSSARYDSLRFFRLWGSLAAEEPNPGDVPSLISVDLPGIWDAPGRELVYAPRATLFRPFGPEGPAVDFPSGYSLLRRSCAEGTARPTMDVAPTADDLIELRRRPDETVGYDPTHAFELERRERAFLESCGVPLPALDLGVRASFDRGQQLVFAPDGASLYYLSTVEPSDPSRTAAVRTLRLADGNSSEILAVPFTTRFAVDATGQLYIATISEWGRVTTSAGAASRDKLPIPPDASLSPNGRWFVFSPESDGHHYSVWEVSTGSTVDAGDGIVLGWSPGSDLVLQVSPDSASVIIRSLTDQKTNTKFDFPSLPFRPQIAWKIGTPVVTDSPLSWQVQPGAFGGCEHCFGLSLQDPGGAPRTALAASAGRVHLVPTPPSTPFVLGWARTCLGLYNTVCTHSLLRVSLDNATSQVVAVASEEVPVAVSPDNKRVALATAKGIYLKDLP